MDYQDIIDMPRHVSKKHPPMDRENRAAQFAPFAALTGFGASITEGGRLTDRRIEKDESRKQELDAVLSQLMASAGHPEVVVTHFVQDLKKEGGSYEKVRGFILRLSGEPRSLVLRTQDGVVGISTEDITEIEPVL